MATPKEYETTTGTARHALQLLDAGSDDLTVGVTLMDANFPHKTAKIGQLIRRERHADVYSVLDPENDSAYSGHEARAFVLDGIPRKLKRYRKRCVKRFHGRSLLEAPFRGAMVIVYATDLMIRYDDVDKDEVLGSYASDETNYSTSKSLILKDSVVVKGFATLSLHDPRHVNCPDRTGIVDRILPQDMKNESAKVEDLPKLPDLADTTRYKQEVSRIRQLERRRAKRKRKASVRMHDISPPSDDQQAGRTEAVLKFDNVSENDIFILALHLWTTYDDEGNFKSLKRTHLLDTCYKEHRLRKLIVAEESHRRWLIGDIKDVSDTYTAWKENKTKQSLLIEVQKELSAMDYRQLFSSIHFTLRQLDGSMRCRLYVSQHINLVLPRLIEGTYDIEGQILRKYRSLTKQNSHC